MKHPESEEYVQRLGDLRLALRWFYDTEGQAGYPGLGFEDILRIASSELAVIYQDARYKPKVGNDYEALTLCAGVVPPPETL